MELIYGMCVLLMVMQVGNFRPSGSTDDFIITGYGAKIEKVRKAG